MDERQKKTEFGVKLNQEGFAAEHDVAARLVRLGFSVARSNANAPWDLVADWRGRVSRLQIKCILGPTNATTPTHRIPLRGRYRIAEGAFDFLVVSVPWGFYIIPIEEAIGKRAINLWERGSKRRNPKEVCAFEGYREAWEVLK
jgi:hypothetical protein